MRRLNVLARLVAAGLVSCLGAWVLVAAPATAAVLGRATGTASPELSRVEATEFGGWWGAQVRVQAPVASDVPISELREAAEGAWAAGVTRRQLRAALFTDAAQDLFAANAAGGEGRPSPYLAYFQDGPAQLGALGDFLSAHREHVGGPGGTQEQMFAEFDGLRASYLASLGLVEVDGRIVDPRNPSLTPYAVLRVMGPPPPLPQPSAP